MQHSHTINPNRYLGDWTIEAPVVEKVVIEGLEIFLCGLQAIHPAFGKVVGSAADAGSYPSNRAWFELLERVSIIENIKGSHDKVFNVRDQKEGIVLRTLSFDDVYGASENGKAHGSFQYSESNGVALQHAWPEACLEACLELAERHLVLASWAGMSKPAILHNPLYHSLLEHLTPLYEINWVDFGRQKVSCFKAAIHVCGLFLFPKKTFAPMVLAFGAGISLEESLRKAESEGLQRLGFLWGSEIPTVEPTFKPTHLYHQDYYLYPGSHSKLADWIAGKNYFKYHDQQTNPDTIDVIFVDLTVLPGLNHHVAKALSEKAIPLVFGEWRQREFSSLSNDLIIHPVC